MIGAIIGGIGGAQKDIVDTSNESGIRLAPETELEKYGGQLTSDSLKSLEQMTNAGPGQAAIGQANSQYESLASMLGEYSKSGGAPQAQDWAQAQEFAKSQFAPQQMQIDQSFDEEQMRAKQLAAQLGRSVNDPYIQAQLSKSKMQMQNMLGAQQGAFMGQEARNNSMARLGFTSQLADVRGSLASQAMSNRQALLSLGQGVQGAERNWRYQTGTQWGTGQQSSGGGLGGAMAGGLAGAGMSAGLMGSFMGMGGGGSMGGAAGGAMHGPSLPPANSAVMMPQQMGQTTNQYTPMPQRGSRFAQPAQTPNTTARNQRQYGW